jgi:lipopolysaccharide export system protein LptA
VSLRIDKRHGCFLLFWLLVWSVCGFAVQGMKLVHADSLVILNTDAGRIQNLYGNVQMVQDDAFMQCEKAIFWEAENRAHLQDQVVINDGNHMLWADQVDYEGETRIEKATGHVKVKTGERLLYANRVVYSQETTVAQAQGDVRMEDWIRKAFLSGAFSEYHRADDYGWIKGNPELVIADSTESDTLIIRGLRMEGWGKSQRVVITDSVRIVKGGLYASCQRAEYLAEDSLLVLQMNPFVRQDQQEMTGDTILIRLEETRFRGGEIQGHARVVSNDSTSQNWMAGRHIAIEADGDTLRKVIVTGQAESRFYVEDDENKTTGLNTITGDRIEMRFDSSRVVWVQVQSDPGLCEGKYAPVDPDTLHKKPEAD